MIPFRSSGRGLLSGCEHSLNEVVERCLRNCDVCLPTAISPHMYGPCNEGCARYGRDFPMRTYDRRRTCMMQRWLPLSCQMSMTYTLQRDPLLWDEKSMNRKTPRTSQQCVPSPVPWLWCLLTPHPFSLPSMHKKR